jgi:peroxiredoxin
VPGDSYDGMVKRAKEKNFEFPYLRDHTQDVANAFGAQRTPHVYVLTKKGPDLVVSYIGTIDDNYKDASAVTKTYLSDAIDALLKGKSPNPNFTKAIGCSVKRK